MSKTRSIEVGDYALVLDEAYHDTREDMGSNIRWLASCGYSHFSTWDRSRPEEIMHILRVTKVMPKTILAEGEIHHGFRKVEPFSGRLYRDSVIALADTVEELAILREKISSIGERADEEIRVRAEKFVQPIEERFRKKAFKELQKALPHLYEGVE